MNIKHQDVVIRLDVMDLSSPLRLAAQNLLPNHNLHEQSQLQTTSQLCNSCIQANSILLHILYFISCYFGDVKKNHITCIGFNAVVEL